MAALITPGIHEHMRISPKSTMNEEGTLNLVIEAHLDDDAILVAISNDQAIDSVQSGFLVFPPNMKDIEGNAKSATDVLKEINNIKRRFMEYGKLYGPEAEAKAAFGGFAMLEGLGLEVSDYPAMLKDMDKEATAKKVLKNLCEKFLNFIQNHPNRDTVTFRHKFYRQSKKKHYASIPWNIKGEIVESMDVPVNATKLGFSDWEVEHGKNDGTPVASDTPKKNAPASNAMFGADIEEAPAPHLEPAKEANASNDMF